MRRKADDWRNTSLNELTGKRIFMYMNFFCDDPSIGITKKIRAQIKTFRNMGLEVTYCAYYSGGAVIIDNNEEVIFRKPFTVKCEKFNRYYRRFHLINTVTEYLKSNKTGFDYAYLRWHTFDRKFLSMLRELKNKNTKVVVEAHAYSPDFIPTTLISRYQLFMDKRYSPKAARYIDLVAAMNNYTDIWGIKTVNIDNAIDLDDISERHYVPNRNKAIRFLSVAIERNYHGIDRFINGLKAYYDNGGTEDIRVYFVGKYMDSTKKLVLSSGLRDRCRFVGSKSGEELDRYYDRAEIGIGALAHHRIGMYEGSSLKTKEYFAKGLPFIYGWKEPAFDDTYPYAHRFELCEDPIDIEEVLKFYHGIEDSNYREEMREFARQYYSWDIEFAKLFAELG